MFHHPSRPTVKLAWSLGLAMLLALSVLSAQAQTLSINGSGNTNVTACSSGQLNFTGFYGTSYPGTWTYTWTLYKNGSSIKQTQQTIYCNGFPCQFPSFSHTTPASGMAGSYQLHLKAQQGPFLGYQGFSNQIGVSLGSASPTPILKINGQTGWPIDVCAVGPITLDGSANVCSSDFFVSIQLSDANWNQYNHEAMRWLTSQDYSQYGPIGSFNIKKFAEDQWFIFAPDQYYRVKLATGSPWQETSTLIRIRPSVAAFNINGSAGTAGQPIQVHASGPIVLDGTPTSCPSGYFVSIQLSDANGNRYNHEAMRWLTAQDFSKYGPISSFNIKKFAEDQWFAFVPGQYYRVKLATGPSFAEITKLIQIIP